jgi:hypothetical protein
MYSANGFVTGCQHSKKLFGHIWGSECGVPHKSSSGAEIAAFAESLYKDAISKLGLAPQDRIHMSVI